MKKASTYLFAIMALANLGVGFLISHTVRSMIRTYEHFSSVLPLPTRLLVNVLWWPYIFTFLGVVGVLVSFCIRIESRVLSYALCVILIVEVVLLACTAFGLCVPMFLLEPVRIQGT